MIDKRVKDIVSKLTTEVMDKLKSQEVDKNVPLTGGSINPYLKLTQVKNGYILETNSDNPSQPPETEVIEFDDHDSESVVNMLYGLSEWLGIDDVKKLNITYDGKVSKNETPSNIPPQKNFNQENVEEINRQALQQSFNEDIPKPIAKEEVISKPQKPETITKEMVIRAAMGLPPEQTISQDEVDDGEETTEPPQIQAEPEDYEIEGEEGLKDNEWIDRDYGDDPDSNLSKEEMDELENLPDGDFDEDAGY